MEILIALAIIFGLSFSTSAALYLLGAVMSRLTGKRWL